MGCGVSPLARTGGFTSPFCAVSTGYKHAMPAVASVAAQSTFPFSLKVNCGNGYVEQYVFPHCYYVCICSHAVFLRFTPGPPPQTSHRRDVFSAEDFDIVYACWKGGDTYPTQLSGTYPSQGGTTINYAIFARPSTTLSEVGPVPVGQWWGYAQGDNPSGVGTIANSDAQVMSSTNWLIGENSNWSDTVSIMCMRRLAEFHSIEDPVTSCEP